MSREVVRVELNPELLVWARSSSGFGIDEIASAVDVAPEVVLAWESGEQRPTIRQLERLARKVKRPLAALFLPKAPEEEPPPRDFRLLPATEAGRFTPATLLAFRRARNIQREAVELAEALGETLEVRLLQGSLKDDPEELAKRARLLLGIAVAEQVRWRNAFKALSEWRAALEQTGLLTLQFSMPREDARGFTLDHERLPVIVVTTKDAPEARIFSLFHEYCHLALGVAGVSSTRDMDPEGTPQTPKASVEVFCNRFAAAFLLPYDEPVVKNQLDDLARRPDLDTEAVRTVARRFKVSKEAVLRRMLTQGLISTALYRSLVGLWAREAAEGTSERERKGGADFVALRISERGRRFANLVLEALDQGAISETEASGYLDVYPRHLESIREKIGAGTSHA
jgi:Zn-dependent peptidase ImmA (M78 family)